MASLQVLVLLVVVGLAASSQEKAEICRQGVNCHLPDCFCPTFEHPMGSRNIPQIVYFGFDDAVTSSVGQYYDQLFSHHRLNPNGCPITLSLFVSNSSTQYSLVTKYYQRNFEIGDHSVTHTFINNATKLKDEADTERWFLSMFANIPEDQVRGWRSPDLATAGDAQPTVLQGLNFTYDISLPYLNIFHPKLVPFPFTLDYGYPYPCAVPPCPGKTSSHKGFWEVPINALYDGDFPCAYVDGCRPKTEDAAYEFLMKNFLRSYNNKRAPVGHNMHAAWFYSPKYLAAMDRFIENLVVNYNDVYIVSVNQMIQWLKTPTDVQNSLHFKPWGCQNPNMGLRRKNAEELAKAKANVQVNHPGTKNKSYSPLRNWLLKRKAKAAAQAKKNLSDSFIYKAVIEE